MAANDESSLPLYTNPPGSRTFQQPYTMQGTRAQFFALKASLEKMQAIVDAQLNIFPGAPFTYRPLTPFVNACPMWIDKIWCNNPPDSQMGWMRESDFNFSFFVGAFKPNETMPHHVACYFPYLIVDSPVTMASGREIWGYRKVWGQFEYVPGSYQPVAASTWVLRQYTNDTELQMAEVARVLPPAPMGEHPVRTLLDDAVSAVADVFLKAGVIAENVLSAIHDNKMNMVFLQETRDAQYPERAAYQALIEAPMTITHSKSAVKLNEGYSIQLSDYASFPLISNMGIEVENGIAKSVLSTQLEFDCTLDNGVVIASAGRTPTATSAGAPAVANTTSPPAPARPIANA